MISQTRYSVKDGSVITTDLTIEQGASLKLVLKGSIELTDGKGTTVTITTDLIKQLSQLLQTADTAHKKHVDFDSIKAQIKSELLHELAFQTHVVDEPAKMCAAEPAEESKKEEAVEQKVEEVTAQKTEAIVEQQVPEVAEQKPEAIVEQQVPEVAEQKPEQRMPQQNSALSQIAEKCQAEPTKTVQQEQPKQRGRKRNTLQMQ